MSTEAQIAALEARVAELERQHTDFIERTKDDDETFRQFAARINEYGARTEKGVSEIYQAVAKTLAELSEKIYRQFSVKVATDAAAQAAAQVTPEVIAASLTKKVLVTRPANREELRTGQNVLAVRQAGRNE